MEHCLLACLRCILATSLLLNPSAAEFVLDPITTEDYQNHQILDGSEDAQNLCSHGGDDCVVHLLQTSIMLKPTPLPLQPQANITATQAVLIQSSSRLVFPVYAYVTWLIIISVGLLVFMLSAPITHSPCKTPDTPQDQEPDVSKPVTQTTMQSQTKTSKCPNLNVLDALRLIGITWIISLHFDMDHNQEVKASPSGLQFFMILCGFIRVVTAKEPDPTSRVGQSFRHHVARLLARFCPAYYLALTWTIMQERENVSILAPVQASFLSGFVTNGLTKKIGMSCGHAKVPQDCWTFFGHSWFVADIFVLVLLFPLWDLIPRMIQKCWARVMLLVIFAILPEYLMYDRGWNQHSVWVRALQLLAGMMAAHIAKQLSDRVSQWTGWHYLLDCTFALVLFRWFVVDAPTAPQAIQQFAGSWWGESLMGSTWCLLMVCNYYGTMNGSFGIFSSICEWLPVASVAVYAFGAYIYQFNVHTTLEGLFPVFTNTTSSSTCLTIALSWVVAVASEKLVERPVRLWVEARMKGSGKAP